MADRFTRFLMHPATQMAAGIMAGSDPQMQGLGGVGQGIMSAGNFATQQQQLEDARRAAALKAQAAGLPDYSKSPLYFRDPQGRFQVGQLSPGGDLHFPEVPEGLEAVRPMTEVQTGAGTYLLPQGATGPGPGSGYIPREVPPEQEPEFKRQQAEATATGREEGTFRQQARQRLPAAIIDANRTLARLNQLRSHDALAAAVGASSWLPVIRGTGRADFVARMDQIMGGAFLQAFEQLKGGGQITQVEGEKATAAITRMSEATSEEAFFAAMDDYAEAIQDGILKLQAAAEREQTGIEIPWRAKPTTTPVSGSGTGRLSRRQRREELERIRRERGM